MLKCDLHLHAKEDESAISYTAKELIDRAAKLNFDVLSFTFHNKLFYPKELVEYAESKDILLVPGAELTINRKHVLVYGMEDISEINTFGDLKHHFAVAPHPFFKLHQCLGEELVKNIHMFDGIEYCHFYNHLVNWNKRSVEVAKEFDKPLIGNSDCHIMNLQFDRTYSLIDSDKDMNSIFGAIKNNKVCVVSDPLKLSEFFKVGFKQIVTFK